MVEQNRSQDNLYSFGDTFIYQLTNGTLDVFIAFIEPRHKPLQTDNVLIDASTLADAIFRREIAREQATTIYNFEVANHIANREFGDDLGRALRKVNQTEIYMNLTGDKSCQKLYQAQLDDIRRQFGQNRSIEDQE